MSAATPDVVLQFVYGVRLHHTLSALGFLANSDAWSRFEGSIESGFRMSFDPRGGCLAMAWGERGLVALVDISEDHKNDPNGPLSRESAIARYLGDLPADMQDLLNRITSHAYLSELETASAGFWLARESPNLVPLDDEHLHALRGFLCSPEVAIHGDGARWEGWKETLYLTKETIQYGIALEQATRHTPYELRREEAELFIPPEFLDALPEPPDDTVTSNNVAEMLEMLAQVGICWGDIAKSRGAAAGDDDDA